jgi:hypothetical protein
MYASMRALFLDTASAEPRLALCTEERTLTLKPLPKQGESKVTLILEEALREAQWHYDSHVNSQGEHVAGLTHIACIVGPGGFVSLRIGITAANTLAWALALPLAGIHLSDLWAARAFRVESGTLRQGSGRAWKVESDLYWLHSTRKTPGQLFARGFGTFEKRFPEPILIDLEDAKKLQGKYVGELIEEHQKVLIGCSPLRGVQPLEAVLPSFLQGLEYKHQQLLPWYGREA